MSQIRNLTFPIVARKRKSPETDLIGVASLELLQTLQTKGKQHQYVINYNYLNKSRNVPQQGRAKVWYKPVYSKTQDRAKQTTFVIDFDKIAPEDMAGFTEAFEEFNMHVGNAALLLESPSGTGRHVLFIAGGVAKEQMFRRIQEAVIQGWFLPYKQYVDSSASFSPERGFFHSQHLAKWVEQGYVNPTLGKQGPNRKFWSEDLELSFAEISAILDVGEPIEKRSVEALSYDITKTNAYLNHILRSMNNNEPEEDPSRKARKIKAHKSRRQGALKYRDVDAARCAVRLCGIMAELLVRHESDQDLVQADIQRAQSQQCEAAYNFLKSDACQAVCRTSGLSEVLGLLVKRDNSSGEDLLTDGNGQDQVCDEQVGVQGHSGSGIGHGSGSALGDDQLPGTGLCLGSGSGSVLDVMESLRLCVRRSGIRLKELGSKLSTDVLRSHQHWSLLAEECDIALFFTVMRQAMATDTRIQGAYCASSASYGSWLKHASNYLSAQPNVERSLLEFAQNASRIWRLCLKAQGIEVRDNYKLSNDEVALAMGKVQLFDPNKVDNFIDYVLVDNIAEFGKDVNKANLQSIARMYREEPDRLRMGVQELFAYLSKLRPLMERGELIAIGVAEFERFFGTHIRKAGALRVIFMNALAHSNSDYVACVKRKSYRINLFILDHYASLETKRYLTPQRPEELARHLGKGRTWDSIKRYSKPMLISLGLQKSLEVWYRALELANVNDLQQRQKDVKRFLVLIMEQNLPEQIAHGA